MFVFVKILFFFLSTWPDRFTVYGTYNFHYTHVWLWLFLAMLQNFKIIRNHVFVFFKNKKNSEKWEGNRKTPLALHFSSVAPSIILWWMSLRQAVSGGTSHVNHITKEKILYFEKWQTNGAWKHALPNSNYHYFPQPLQKNSTQSTSSTPVCISSIMN